MCSLLCFLREVTIPDVNSERSGLDSLTGLMASASDSRLFYTEDDLDDVSNVDHQQLMHEAFAIFNQLRRTAQLCDVVIVVSGKKLSAHKVVLCARIPYFQAMFCTDMMESRQNEVHLYEVDYETMESLLEYAYTAKMQLTASNVQNIMIGANFLQVESLVDECGRYIKDRLRPSNAIPTFLFCRSIGYPHIEKFTLRFIEKHFMSIRTRTDFVDMDEESAVMILSRDGLHVEGEEEVFNAAITWIEHSPDTRRAHAARLLACVRLPLLRPSFLSDAVSTHNLLKEDMLCRDLIDEAKDYHLMPERRSQFKSFRTRARVCHDVTCLIYALGGLANSSRQEQSMVEVYDPASKSWTSSKPMTSVRSRIGVAVFDRKIYALGGFDGGQRLDLAEYFDTLTNDWHTIPPLIHKRSAMAAVFLDGLLFVCGGYDGISSLSCVESYDISKRRWRMEKSMDKQRSASGAAVVDGCIYVVGGHDGMSIFASCEKYSTETGIWESIPSMITKRCRHGVAALQGKLYVAGGYDGSQFLSSVECFDIEKGEWSAVSPMNLRRCRVCLAVSNNNLYAIGGFDGLNNLSSCEMYDPDTDTWNLCPSLRDHAGGVSIGVVPVSPHLSQSSLAFID